jgi:hypothetical protein
MAYLGGDSDPDSESEPAPRRSARGAKPINRWEPPSKQEEALSRQQRRQKSRE